MSGKLGPVLQVGQIVFQIGRCAGRPFRIKDNRSRSSPSDQGAPRPLSGTGYPAPDSTDEFRAGPKFLRVRCDYPNSIVQQGSLRSTVPLA